jgi:hypothetical protein
MILFRYHIFPVSSEMPFNVAIIIIIYKIVTWITIDQSVLRSQLDKCCFLCLAGCNYLVCADKAANLF